ncbi:MAG: hypothetical protein HY920_01355 [Elusimicrobia bacterium]|nr:hypothetical protein [Elusimicrobiota bacterium]
MKTISIYNLEDKVAALLRQKAKESNMSLNKTVQKLLKKFKCQSTKPKIILNY